MIAAVPAPFTEPTAETTPSGMDRFDYIDALRGWAILGVFVGHISIYCYTRLPHPLDALLLLGGRGVQLFYVISAFTLFLSMHRRERLERRPVRNFFIRRFFRIAPMWYIAMIIYLLANGLGPRYWLGDQPGITAANLVANAFFVGGWHPYWINSIIPGGWSVHIEFLFYALVPYVARRVGNLAGALWLFLSVTVASTALDRFMITLRPINVLEIWQNFVFMWFPSQAPVFCLGIVLYYLWKEPVSRKLAPWCVAFAVWLMGIASFGGYTYLPGHIVFAAAFVALTVGLAGCPYSLFVNPITRTLGKVSYSLYLTHFLVAHWCAVVLNKIYRLVGYTATAWVEFSLLFIVGIVGCYVAAAICYRFVEKPGIERGRRWIAKLEAA